MAQNTGKSDFFCIISTALTEQKLGVEGRLLYFMGKLCKYVSGKLEYKLQVAVPVLCWYFFNLNEKTVGIKGIFFRF